MTKINNRGFNFWHFNNSSKNETISDHCCMKLKICQNIEPMGELFVNSKRTNYGKFNLKSLTCKTQVCRQ